MALSSTKIIVYQKQKIVIQVPALTIVDHFWATFPGGGDRRGGGGGR